MNQGDDFGDDKDKDMPDVSQYSTVGPHGMKLEAQMVTTENIDRNTGWLDESPDGFFDISTTQLETEVVQPSQKWKAAVQIKRQEGTCRKKQKYPI